MNEDLHIYYKSTHDETDFMPICRVLIVADIILFIALMIKWVN